jgi:hypothetical protein
MKPAIKETYNRLIGDIIKSIGLGTLVIQYFIPGILDKIDGGQTTWQFLFNIN